MSNIITVQVRPRVLSIERSGLSLFRPGAFSNIGRRLKVLQLRNNIIKRIEPVMFKDLDRLKALDLGGNKISAVISGKFILNFIACFYVVFKIVIHFRNFFFFFLSAWRDIIQWSVAFVLPWWNSMKCFKEHFKKRWCRFWFKYIFHNYFRWTGFAEKFRNINTER